MLGRSVRTALRSRRTAPGRRARHSPLSMLLLLLLPLLLLLLALSLHCAPMTRTKTESPSGSGRKAPASVVLRPQLPCAASASVRQPCRGETSQTPSSEPVGSASLYPPPLADAVGDRPWSCRLCLFSLSCGPRASSTPAGPACPPPRRRWCCARCASLSTRGVQVYRAARVTPCLHRGEGKAMGRAYLWHELKEDSECWPSHLKYRHFVSFYLFRLTTRNIFLTHTSIVFSRLLLRGAKELIRAYKPYILSSSS